jgi:hypothetical protein
VLPFLFLKILVVCQLLVVHEVGTKVLVHDGHEWARKY